MTQKKCNFAKSNWLLPSTQRGDQKMKVSWNCFWTNSVITYTQFISSLASCLVVQFEKVEVETKQRQNFNTSLARPRMQDIWKWNLPILCLKSSFGQHKPLVCIKKVHFLGRGKKFYRVLVEKKLPFLPLQLHHLH